MSRLIEKVSVVREGDDLLSIDGLRRFLPYGEPEWAWWVEVTTDGKELPGLWEFWEEEGLAVCMCG